VFQANPTGLFFEFLFFEFLFVELVFIDPTGLTWPPMGTGQRKRSPRW
jgi:hypothetical protein